MHARFRSMYHRAVSSVGRLKPPPDRKSIKEIKLLEGLLWRGRSSEAEPRIASLIENPEVPANVKTIGRSALACWYYHNGDPGRALRLLKTGLAADKRALERPMFKRALVTLHIALWML